MRRLFPLLLALPMMAAAAQIELSREALCEHADRVVVGEVTGVEARFGLDDTIERVVHLSLQQTLKGDPLEGLTVVVPGGTVGDLTLWVEHSPVFLENAIYLVFLTKEETVLAGEQGVIRITPAGSFRGEPLAQVTGQMGVCLAK